MDGRHTKTTDKIWRFIFLPFIWLTWPIRPGSSFQSGALKLAAWSLLITTFFLFVGEMTFPGGAFQFTDYARALTRGTAGPHLSARDIGYPLLLLATGFQFSHSFAGLILLQAAMAWAMPLLVYGIVGQRFRSAAYWAGLATIVSMAPYLFMKMVHHDQLYIFLSLLTIYLAVIFLGTCRAKHLYLAIISLVAASLTRPAGNLLALPLLLLFWFFRPAYWRHYLTCAIIVSICLFVYAEHRTQLLGFTMEGSVPSYKGRQIFYNLYVNSPDFGVRVDESLGPATARLFANAREELKMGSLNGNRLNIWYRSHNFPEAAKKFWFTQFDENNDAFIESLIQHPSHDYFEFFCWVETTDQVFLSSAIEIARKYPLYPIRVTLRNVALFFWTPGYAHGRFGLSFNSFNPEGLLFIPLHGDISRAQIEAYVPSPGKLELLAPDPALVLTVREKAKRIEEVWIANYHTVNRIAFVLALIALAGIFFGESEMRSAAAITWLFFLYNALVTCAFAEPNYRYHFFVLPILFTLAGLGMSFVLGTAARIIDSEPRLRAARCWGEAASSRASKSGEAAPSRSVNSRQKAVGLAIALTGACVAVGWAYLLQLQSGVRL